MSQRKADWLNAEEFKATTNQVTGTADHFYALMRPLLATP